MLLVLQMSANAEGASAAKGDPADQKPNSMPAGKSRNGHSEVFFLNESDEPVSGESHDDEGCDGAEQPTKAPSR